MTGDEFPPYVLPVEFYKARDELAVVRQWGKAMLVPPDLLFGQVLTGAALTVPTSVVLPPIISAPAPLNLGIVNAAPTGVGKTAARQLADTIEGVPKHHTEPLGTGEGLTEAQLGPSVDGEREPHGEPSVVRSDEGRILEDLIERRGSTLVTNLLSAISGAELGQGNANGRRYVPAFSYRVAVQLNIQPKYLRGVIADPDVGLPQRFIYLAGTGHHLDEADIDAAQPTTPITIPQLDPPAWSKRFSWGRRTFREFPIPSTVRDEVRRTHYERLLAETNGHDVTGSSHRNLNRLRVAALLAVLAGRAAVSIGDWDLAALVVDVSDAVIADAARLRRVEQAAADAETARRAVRIEGVKDAARAEQVARKLVRIVADEPDGITAQEVRRFLSNANRGVLDDAVRFGVERGWLLEHKEPGQGEPRRVLHLGAFQP